MRWGGCLTITVLLVLSGCQSSGGGTCGTLHTTHAKNPTGTRIMLDEDGALLRVDRDMDHDGVVDRQEVYEGTRLPSQISLDQDADGTFDLLLEFDAQGSITRYRNDLDATADADELVTRIERVLSSSIELDEPTEACGHDPDCENYLGVVQDRVLRAWPRSSSRATEHIDLRMRIDERGCPFRIRVVLSGSDEVTEHCIRALQAAVPLPAPPGTVANRDLRALFWIDQ